MIKAKPLRQVLVRRKVIHSGVSRLLPLRPSSHPSAGRDFQRGGEGKQNNGIRGGAADILAGPTWVFNVSILELVTASQISAVG